MARRDPDLNGPQDPDDEAWAEECAARQKRGVPSGALPGGTPDDMTPEQEIAAWREWFAAGPGKFWEGVGDVESELGRTPSPSVAHGKADLDETRSRVNELAGPGRCSPSAGDRDVKPDNEDRSEPPPSLGEFARDRVLASTNRPLRTTCPGCTKPWNETEMSAPFCPNCVDAIDMYSSPRASTGRGREAEGWEAWARGVAPGDTGDCNVATLQVRIEIGLRNLAFLRAESKARAPRVGEARPMPDGWQAHDDEDLVHCEYGIDDGVRGVWVDDDGLNVLHDNGKSGAQWAPLSAVLHVLGEVGALGATPPVEPTLECPCCGEVAARGTVDDGDKFICGCPGWVSLDPDHPPSAILDDEVSCPKCDRQGASDGA